MEDKNWEDGLKDMLANYKPEDIQPDWDSFANYLHVHEQITEWEENEAFDESIKESVSDFEATTQDIGWQRIESSLNLADQQFDQHIRDKINEFDPKYTGTWSLLLQRLSGVAYLRAKLIAFKIVEIAAVMLLLFTTVKMGQMGKLPFETPLFKNSPQKNDKLEMADNFSAEERGNQANQNVQANGTSDASSGESIDPDQTASLIESAESASGLNENEFSSSGRDDSAIYPIPVNDILPVKNEKVSFAAVPIDIASTEAEISYGSDHEKSSGGKSIFKKLQVANFLGTILSPIRWSHDKSLPRLAYVKQPSKTFTEFGIVTQLDYNKLRMPEDRLYSAGRQIVFPQQGIPSANMGGGFTFAIAHPRWAIESGVIYSAKNFKPGRQLVVGGTFNNGSVEFEAMRLQLVSVPLHYRYKFDYKGPFKVYGLAGLGLNLIAQSNIDVVIEYQFPSLSFGGDPNTDPTLGPIIKETRRISEHIRDGAPFSTKSFFSVEAGAGIEYAVSEHKSLFLQSAVQYQVPNLGFSNNNGKHIRSVSLQAGVRTPLGN